MSEIATVKGGGLLVTEVADGSPAARAGVQPGDILVSANGVALEDVIQLRYESAEPQFTLTVRRDEAEQMLHVERDYGEDLGLTFRLDVADKIHTCNNKCVFCFIHQMPKRMRRSLYLMDDDYRLSFLHGNYVTLTNLKPGEFERICEQRLSPMYVSVHATDPELRGRMLGKREPAPILPMLHELAESGIDVHAQVVLCPGWNDGPALEHTARALSELHPARSGLGAGVLSVAVVPVGLSKHRERLTQLEPVDGPCAARHLDVCEGLRNELRARLKTAFLFPSDEWFVYAEREFPPAAWYEDFPQYEDGVGTCRTFIDEADIVLKRALHGLNARATLLTAKLACRPVQHLIDGLNRLPGVDLNVAVVENEYFGPRITVAGLMTGQDMLRRMEQPDVSDRVYVPSICVNSNGLLLDDIPAADLRAMSAKDVRLIEPSPDALLRAL